jgi:hypothetical protein
MAETAERKKVSPAVIEAMREGERAVQWLQEHPEALAPYRGEWIVIHGVRIVAHSADAAEVARAAPSERYPGGLLLYVETEEEARTVHV